MDSLRISLAAICLMLACAAGCKKDPQPSAAGGGTAGGPSGAPSAPAAAPSAAPAAAAAPAENDVVGKWAATKIDDGSEPPLPKGLLGDMMSSKIEVLPDHTYRFLNTMGGRVHGTWKLAGNELQTLPDGAAPSLTSSYTVDPPRLLWVISTKKIIFEKQGSASTDSTPKFRLNAKDLKKEVSGDFAAAQKKYDGVSVELTGIITSIDLMGTGPYFKIDGPPGTDQDPSDLFLGISCRPLEPELWSTIGWGQPVKMTGVATLLNGAVEFTEARFVLDGPSILLTTTADALAADFARDPEMTKKKYTRGHHGRALIITGTLSEKQIKEGTASLVYLGQRDARVLCEYTNDGWDAPMVALKQMQVGQQIKFAGEFDPYGDGKIPKLTRCKLVTK